MLKQTKSILMVLMLLIALPFAAFAEENTTVTEDDDSSDVQVSVEGVSIDGETVAVVTDTNEIVVKDDTVEITTTSAVELEDETEVEDEAEVEAEVEDETEVEDEAEVEAEEVPEEEVAIISTELGAKIRLIQLQKKLEAHIEGANLIIAEIEKRNDTTIDTTKLKSIVSEFEILSQQAMDADLNQSADALAAEYVAMKKQAINLTSEFGKTVKAGLSEEQKLKIRAQVEEKKKERLEVKDEDLEKLKHEFNAEKAKHIMKRYGIENPEMIAQIKAGNISVDEVKAEFKMKFDSLNDEQRNMFMQKAKEEEMKIKIQNREERKQIINEADKERQVMIEDFKQNRE